MTPYIYLAAAPKAVAVVRTLTRQQGVRQLLEEPPYTRYEGWNLTTLDRATIVAGRRLELANGKRKHITLHDDGTFVAVGTVPDFLAWHSRNLPNKINTLALIEFVYNFVLVYDKVLDEIEPLPGEIRLGLGLRHAIADERPLYIAYGRVDRMDYEMDFVVKAAQADSFDHVADVEISDAEPHFDLGAAAYRLIVPLYNWFGFEDEAVPYTDEERARIDVEQIVAP